MNKNRIILSIIGLGALVIPVVLLIVFTGKSAPEPKSTSGERQINPATVQEVVDSAPSPKIVELPSPSPATPSALEGLEGSPAPE